MMGSLMGLASGIATALLVSGVISWALPGVRLPQVKANAAGIGALAGMLMAVFATIVTGFAFNLVMWLTLFAIAIAALVMVMEWVRLHVAFRLAGTFIVMAVMMWFLYWRGDIYAVPAAVSAALGSIIITAWSFASRSADAAGLWRVAPVTFSIGAAYMVWIGLRLPNPGLVTFAAFTLMAVAPTLLARSGGVLFGPALGALAWASGFYAWLGNASLPMVLAPAVIPLADVVWTLGKRLATAEGRAELAHAGGWWKQLDEWAQPGRDLIVTTLPPRFAGLAAAAAVLASVVVGLVGWHLGLGTVLAAAPLVLLAACWIALDFVGRSTRAPRRAA